MIAKIKRLSSASKVLAFENYAKAKNGCLPSALNLVDFLSPKLYLKSNADFICPVLSQNMIPLALAMKLSMFNNIDLYQSIALENKCPYRKISLRLLWHPLFSGPVSNGNYIIVDDIYTTGITLINLKHYIESNGGNVVHCITLGSSKSTRFEPSRLQMKILLSRFPLIQDYFDPNLITDPMARFMLRFDTLQKLHNTINYNQYNCL